MSRNSKHDEVETIGRVRYWTTDSWATVWCQKGRRGRPVEVTGEEADLARFLAIAQSTSEGGRS